MEGVAGDLGPPAGVEAAGAPVDQRLHVVARGQQLLLEPLARVPARRRRPRAARPRRRARDRRRTSRGGAAAPWASPARLRPRRAARCTTSLGRRLTPRNANSWSRVFGGRPTTAASARSGSTNRGSTSSRCARRSRHAATDCATRAFSPRIDDAPLIFHHATSGSTRRSAVVRSTSHSLSAHASRPSSCSRRWSSSRHREQVLDVGGGVAAGGVGQRALRPVGQLLRLVEPDAEQHRHQRAERRQARGRRSRRRAARRTAPSGARRWRGRGWGGRSHPRA